MARQLVSGFKANATMVCRENGKTPQQLTEGGEFVEQLDNH